MAWEYLPQMDQRLRVIASFLKGKTKDKTIVDLDCLEARLLKYIDHDFKKYIGNDILDRFPVSIDKTEFYLTTDEKMVDVVNECNILLVLGAGGWEITKEELESKTLTDSVNAIIKKCRPKYVVKEAVSYFEELINLPPNGYKQVYKKNLNLGDKWIAKRIVYIYKRI